MTRVGTTPRTRVRRAFQAVRRLAIWFRITRHRRSKHSRKARLGGPWRGRHAVATSRRHFPRSRVL